MFAQKDGAVAAPTASLHFTPELMEAVHAAGIETATLTLHVGAGTFLPVKADDTDAHKMHSEWGIIDAATADRLNDIRKAGGRLIAVGTTSLRLVESAVDENGVVRPFEGDTDIFIIQSTGNLVQVANTDVILTNGALAKNIFWQLAGHVVVGEKAHLEGILLVKTDVLFETKSSLNGRVLAETACNLQMATITEPPL